MNNFEIVGQIVTPGSFKYSAEHCGKKECNRQPSSPYAQAAYPIQLSYYNPQTGVKLICDSGCSRVYRLSVFGWRLSFFVFRLSFIVFFVRRSLGEGGAFGVFRLAVGIDFGFTNKTVHRTGYFLCCFHFQNSFQKHEMKREENIALHTPSGFVTLHCLRILLQRG